MDFHHALGELGPSVLFPKLYPGEREIKESDEAIAEQKRLGIIQPNGLTAGVTLEMLGDCATQAASCA